MALPGFDHYSIYFLPTHLPSNDTKSSSLYIHNPTTNTKMPRALKDGIHNPNDEHTSSDEEQDQDQDQEQGQEQQDQGLSRVDHDFMGITTQGRPPRVSRRRRSEYTPTWQRAKAVSSTGHTGSKYRSTSRHWYWFLNRNGWSEFLWCRIVRDGWGYDYIALPEGCWGCQ